MIAQASSTWLTYIRHCLNQPWTLFKILTKIIAGNLCSVYYFYDDLIKHIQCISVWTNNCVQLHCQLVGLALLFAGKVHSWPIYGWLIRCIMAPCNFTVWFARQRFPITDDIKLNIFLEKTTFCLLLRIWLVYYIACCLMVVMYTI